MRDNWKLDAFVIAWGIVFTLAGGWYINDRLGADRSPFIALLTFILVAALLYRFFPRPR